MITQQNFNSPHCPTCKNYLYIKSKLDYTSYKCINCEYQADLYDNLINGFILNFLTKEKTIGYIDYYPKERNRFNVNINGQNFLIEPFKIDLTKLDILFNKFQKLMIYQ